MVRLFLLYFPGYYDGDEIIGIYDDISKLKMTYERILKDENHEYEVFLNNSRAKLTIEEFYREEEEFKEVDPETLWDELDKQSVYGKGPFFLVVTAEEWNHDADEWLGIYTDKKDAREAYDRAVVWWEEENKASSYNTPQKVTMFEYIPEEDHFREVSREELGG